MGWNGWFTYNGTEIINVERTARYAKAEGAYWFIDTAKSDGLAKTLGDDEYRTPLQDVDAPWVDPDVPDGYGFYGAWPLDVTGLDDSTRTSTITENNADGGNVGKLRHGTRQMVFSVVLIGVDDAAVDAGLAWLKSALLPNNDSNGNDMCFFASKPAWDPAFPDCGDDLLRTFHAVTINTGPTVTNKHSLPDGGAAWEVTFTAVAGIPWQFGSPVKVLDSFLSTDPDAPIPNPAGGDVDSAGHLFAEVACPLPVYSPVFDPSCPDLVLPPVAPPVEVGCFDAPANWLRFSFSIPAELVRVWTDVVPLMDIHVGTTQLRNMRVRFYSDISGSFDPDLDPCAFCADFWITYAPEDTTLRLDGQDETITVFDHGQSRRADGLVYDSNHMPFTWPRLSYGMGYVVTLDFEQTQQLPVIDFSLVPRIA